MRAALAIGQWCLFASTLLLLTACIGSKQAASGIEGTVIIGPSQPETSRSSSEAGKPFETTILIKDSTTERQVAVVQAATDGTFSIALPPGEYIVEPESPRPFVPPFAEAQTVTVHEGQITTITIVYDSGIR